MAFPVLSVARPGARLRMVCAGLLTICVAAMGAPSAAQSPGSPPAALAFRFGGYHATFAGLALPSCAAIDDDGTVYVADAGDHRLAVFASDGRLLRAFGSLGEGDGQFHSPLGLALGPDHLIYVCDSGNDRVQVLDHTGVAVRKWGTRGVAPGQLCSPQGIAVSGDRVCIADTGNQRVQVFRADGTLIKTFGERGRGDGQFNRPTDIAIDDRGDMFVIDADNNRVQRFDQDGKFIRGWGDFGPFPGLLNDPEGIACFGGQVFVADTSNHRIQVFAAAGNGEMLRQWGVHDPMAHEGLGKIHYPHDVAIGGPSDAPFAVICEPAEHRCQVFRAAAAGEEEAPRVGIPSGEQTHFGQRLAIDGRLLLIPEPENHFIYLFDLKEEGPIIISQFGQRGTKFGQFIHPTGMLVSEKDRQAVIADIATARLQTFAIDFKPDEPLKFVPFIAKFVRAIDFTHPRFAKPVDAMPWPLLPEAIRRDAQGNLHVLDQRNGMVIVFKAQMEFVRRYGEGQLSSPSDVAFSPLSTSAYVVDAGNFRVQVFDGEGRATISFGSYGEGDGQFRQPFGIAVDRDGNMYVSDAMRDCIQKFDLRGGFVKKWGTRGVGRGEFWSPMGMAIDDRQRLFVLDHGNHRVQMFSLNGDWLGTFGAGKVTLKSQMAE